MIQYLIGKVSYLNSKFIIFDSNFIGYKIKILENEEFQKNKVIRLYIHKIMKIDNKNNLIEEIYGFNKLIEKNFFVDLLTINGIGTTIATNILSSYCIEDIVNFIVNEDIYKLKKIKGLNEKKALIIIASLKSKYQNIIYLENKEQEISNELRDLTYALSELGYNNEDLKIATNYYKDHQSLPLNELIANSIKLIANTKVQNVD